MAFISGPRQVGKTTTCRAHADVYINWDNIDDRELILAGPARLIDHFKLDRLSGSPSVLLFYELYKYPRWKQFLKGFFDTCADQVRIMVTGSSRMEVIRNKEKREVDFIVAREGQPWFLVDVKQHDESISPALKYFQQQLDAPFAFQVVFDTKYIDTDCCTRSDIPVPAFIEAIAVELSQCAGNSVKANRPEKTDANPECAPNP